MKFSNWVRNVGLALAVSALYFCSANPVAPDSQGEMSVAKGIPQDQINWVGWNAEATLALAEAQDGALARRSWGYESKNIRRRSGGKVGGRKTFGNTVSVPEDAFEESKLKISVRVLHFDRSGQNAAGVEFLPSRHYDADMEITLSWKFLNVANSDWENLDLQPLYSEDQGETWNAIEEYVVDPEAKTISFAIDHFTQYGWGLDEDD